MFRITQYTAVVTILVLAIFVIDGNTNKVLSSELSAVQHAANLSSIEKRLIKYSLLPPAELSVEQRKWYDKFQKGNMFVDGWQDISNNVVAKVPEEKKIKTKVTMQALGVRIGCEWSKDNEARRITTDMLKDWGRQLREAVASSSTQIASVIYSIEYEVDHLLGVN